MNLFQYYISLTQQKMMIGVRANGFRLYWVVREMACSRCACF
jgi:hypothetical protein